MTETVVETSTAIVPRAATAALTPRPRPPLLLVSALAWLVAAVVTVQWPNIQNFGLTVDLGLAQGAFAVLSLLAYLLRPRIGIVGDRLDHNAARLTAIAVLLTIWQVATAKTGYWRQPYFPPPQKIVEAYVVDHARLLESIRASLVLLGLGMTIGASVGFLSGLFTGWSPRISYWIQPVLRLIGPIPTTALIPLALFLFPTTFSASLFLLALATWFPVAVLTSSGVASVSTAYYDVARTLGASNRFLLLHIAIPASLPLVFVGLFMGLGHAIAVLVVAEMIGVKAGLGYYLDWAQGWGAYGHLYAALIIMMLLFSTLTLLLFRLRDRLLAWQEDVVAW